MHMPSARHGVHALTATCPTRGRLRQYGEESLERELNKALVGFSRPGRAGEPAAAEEEEEAAAGGEALLPVCSGNWGCGAFGGDLQLKAVLQILAASAAGRPSLRYLTFGDAALAEGIERITARLGAARCGVGDVVRLLLGFRPGEWPVTAATTSGAGCCADLFAYLHLALDGLPRAGADAREPSGARVAGAEGVGLE